MTSFWIGWWIKWICIGKLVVFFEARSILFELTRRSSIHLYTGFGPRDRTQVEREYGRSVYGPDAAEYSIEVAKGLINKAVRLTSFISWIYADLTLPWNN